jgi:excisionase family DNA binding protein
MSTPCIPCIPRIPEPLTSTNPGYTAGPMYPGRAPEVRKLYRIEEVADLLGLGRTAVFEQLRIGRLRSVKIGRCRRVPAEWLDEFVAALKAEAEDAA